MNKQEKWYEDIVYGIFIVATCVLFARLGYYCGYNIAKTEDALMCVRECMQ